MDVEFGNKVCAGKDVYTDLNQATVIANKNSNMMLYSQPYNTVERLRPNY